MAFFDLSVIAIYFVVVFLIGVWVSRSLETSEDLFLAGRSLPWPAIGFSLFASNISSSTMIGLAGAAYSTGIAVANYEWMASFVLLVMAFFFIPVFLRAKITTLPELLERQFERRARVYYSLITILLSIIVDTAGGLYAGSLALKVFFPDLPIWQTCVALALFAGLYTAIGGLKAVVYTDFIQAIVLLVGSFVLTFLVFQRLDFSWASVLSSVPPNHLSLFRPLDDPHLPWLGTIFGLPVLGFWYWSTNQYITQRILAAKDTENARWGAVLGGSLKLIPLFTMVLPGVMAIQLFPDLPHPDMVYPTLIKEILPVGLTGLVVAGLIAAIMSSVDSTLNSASTLVIHDFVLPAKPGISSVQLLRLSRLATIFFMVVAALWAPFIGELGGLYFYLQQSFSILVPPVVVLFVMGVFSNRKAYGLGFSTLAFGHSLGLLFFLLNQFDLITIHFSISAGIVTILSFAFFFLLSEASETPKDKDLRFYKEDILPTKEVAFYQDYRLYALVTFVLLSLIVIYFR